MRLLVDIGNSRIKWRWSEGGTFVGGGVDLVPAPGQEEALFSRIWSGTVRPCSVWVSSVAGMRVRDQLNHWSQAHWRCAPSFPLASRQQCGVTNGYEDPSMLGIDRWCSLIGARSLETDAVFVMSCGTAITLDVLGADGVHQGGLIVPGLHTMIHSLTRTSLGARAEVSPAPFSHTLGRNTFDCIRAGVLAAAAGVLEHTLEALTFREPSAILLSGGDAAVVASAIKRQVRIEPDLLFHGLERLAMQGEIP